MEVSTSVLNVKEENSVQTFYRIETAHSDYFHIDVMDREFVENNTVEKMKRYADNIKNISNIPLDVHLMVKEVRKHIDMFISCEPRIISFHIEATNGKDEMMKLINYIKDENCKVGIAINPETSVDAIYEYLPYIHNVLIMSVHPGKGGQEFIDSSINKIKLIKEFIMDNDLETEIEVDGGVNLENVNSINQAGADIVVAGNAIINSKDYVYTINKLKCEWDNGGVP